MECDFVFANFGKWDISSALKRAFPGVLSDSFGCWTPSKRGILVHKDSLFRCPQTTNLYYYPSWVVISRIWKTFCQTSSGLGTGQHMYLLIMVGQGCHTNVKSHCWRRPKVKSHCWRRPKGLWHHFSITKTWKKRLCKLTRWRNMVCRRSGWSSWTGDGTQVWLHFQQKKSGPSAQNR